MSQQLFDNRQISSSIRFALSLLLLLVLPILLYNASYPWLAFSYSKEMSIFEYFGFTGALLFFVNLGIEYMRRRSDGEKVKLFTIVFAFFALYQLISYTELSRIGHDYLAYQESVRAMLANQSPYFSSYTANHPYIYPPLLTQFMTFVYRLISWSWNAITSQTLSEAETFHFLFFLYQYLQYCITVLCFYLSYRVARKFRINELSAIVLVSFLFIINVPIYRNFSQNQVNLWVLLSILLSILWIERKSILSGAVIALGTHLKLYPIIVAFAWLLSKKWRAITSLTFFLAGIFLIQTNGGNSLNLWFDFLNYAQDLEKGVALRNNSLHSLSYNLSTWLFGSQLDAVNTATTVILFITTAFTVGWILVRIVTRMRNRVWASQDKLIGNMMDGIFLMFFVSPSVWDHHLVSAIPLVLWAASRNPDKVLGSVGLATILIFSLPTFDVHILSYIRLAGLLLLLSVSPVSQEESPTKEVDLFTNMTSFVTIEMQNRAEK